MVKPIRKVFLGTVLLLALVVLCFGWQTGRMTGGGSFFQTEKGVLTRITHGFELHCSPSEGVFPGPNNLEVNWDGGNNFHLEQLTLGICTAEHMPSAPPPGTSFSDYYGAGLGRYNGVAGARAIWHFDDEGEPGVNAHVYYLIVFDAGGNVVLSTSGPTTLMFGNHQAHDN
jgi:hypothetical protein